MKVNIKIVIIVFLIISACIVGYSIIPRDEFETEKNSSENVDYKKLDDVVFEVKTAKVKKGSLIKTVRANGIVRADKELDIIANIDGFIETINIQNGKSVNENEILLELDDREILMEVEEKEANLTKANADFAVELKNEIISQKNEVKIENIDKEKDELKLNYEKGLLSKEKYELKIELLDFMKILTGSQKVDVVKSRTGLNSAKLSLERAKLRLSYTKVRAPFEGVIGNFDLVKGQRVNTGMELFKLFDIEKLRIEVGILENEVGRIEIGSRANVYLNALSDQKYKGKVISISPYIDSKTKTCNVIIELENKDLKIKPGMFAAVQIESQIITDKILIPKEALLVRDKRPLVFTAEGNLAKWKYVDLGEYNDDYYIVTNGVTEGEDIIIEGHYTLAHDANIKVVN